ncbi:Multidrug export protein MepA [bioreactor metagenome]|uniref:Multidrug export protein MepA n=1 Tax=bioreactor metagenome TaxID=1076179 RepID=A0A645CSQ4_9ZZZZ
MKPHIPTIKRIYSVGLPSIIMSSISSVMTFGLNKILIAFTSTATAVLGVYFKLQSFIFMPVFGLNNGMVPIISYNFGARKPDRIMQTIRLSILYAVTILLIGMAVFQLFPARLIGIFNPSPEMLAIGIPALRIISLSYFFPGFCIVVISVCQALGHGLKSLFISVVRQLVVLLPVAWLLSLTGRLDSIWFAFPIAEVCALTMCVFFLRRIYRQEIKPLEALSNS